MHFIASILYSTNGQFHPHNNLSLSSQTLICLASCSLCLALPLADSAAEAEAVADADAEARYGAYGGYYRTSARAGELLK